jgi:hypothetical protein
MNYEEQGFKAVWEREHYLINGHKWYCYCAFTEPKVLHCCKMDNITDKMDNNLSPSMYSVIADFYLNKYEIDETIRNAHESGADIGKYGELVITKGKI